MAISGQCEGAIIAEIFWTRDGRVVYTSGVFEIDLLDHELEVVKNNGTIVSVKVYNKDFQTLQCCPDGYHYDAEQQACVPGQAPPPPPPPPPPQCPDGFHWDATLETCVPDNPQITIPPFPCPEAGGDPTDLGQQIGQVLCGIYEILVEIKVNITIQPQPIPAECCNKVVAALQALDKSVNEIVAELKTPHGEPPPPNLTPLVDALDAIKGALDELGLKLPADITPVVDAIDRLTAQTKESDDAIVKAIDGLGLNDPALLAKVQQVVSYMDDQGTIDPSLGQIILS